jgi:spermidine synthase
VVVAEWVRSVGEWNRERLSRLAGQPIDDARTQVPVADVRLVLKRERAGFAALLLDVDNGPKRLSRRENDWLPSLPRPECGL